MSSHPRVGVGKSHIENPSSEAHTQTTRFFAWPHTDAPTECDYTAFYTFTYIIISDSEI